MKRIAVSGLCTLFLLGAGATCSWGAPKFQDGLWEMTMETTMTGLPFAVPPTSVVIKQCLTEKEFVPKDPNSNCTFSKMTWSGNKAIWEAVCDQNGTKATSSGEMTYSATSCSGTSKTVITSTSGSMTANTNMKGKRLGKCNGEEQSVSINGQDVKDIEEQAKKLEQAAQQEQARQPEEPKAKEREAAGETVRQEGASKSTAGDAAGSESAGDRAVRKLRSVFGF